MWVPAKSIHGSNSNELEPEIVAKDSIGAVESLEEHRGTSFINQEEQGSLDMSNDDILTMISSDATSATDNENKRNNHTIFSEEIPGNSSVIENSTKEKVEIEHRDYDVFIINDGQKTTASRASIIGNVTFMLSTL